MYSGELTYDGEDDHVDVERLIVRPDELALQLSTTWGSDGAYTFDGVAPAVGANLYRTAKFFARNSAGIPERIHSEIELSVCDHSAQSIQVVGAWIVNGEHFRFAGELALSVRPGS